MNWMLTALHGVKIGADGLVADSASAAQSKVLLLLEH